MRIECIWAESWKSFGERQTLPLAPITLLIGPNNAGKSNALEILLTLKEFASSPNVGSWLSDQTVERFLRRGPGPATIGLKFSHQEWTGDYSLTLSLDAASNQRTFLETYTTPEFSFKSHPGGVQSSGGWQAIGGLQQSGLLRFESNGGALGNTKLLLEILRSYDVWRANPDAIAASSPVQKVVRLQSSGGNAAALLDHIRDRYPDAYQALQDDIRRCAPEITRVVAEASENPGSKEIYFHQVDGMAIRARYATEGLKFLLFVLLILHSPDRPQIMAFEEIEHGVHPRRLRDVVGFLRQIAAADGGRQLLITSHSPLVLDQFKDVPEQVLVLERDSNSTTKVTRLPKILQDLPPESSDAALGDLWYSGLLGGVPQV